MTFTMIDLLLMVIAVGLAVAAVALWRLTSRAAVSIERAADSIVDLSPKFEKLAERGSAELEELRGLTRRSHAVAADVQLITGEVAQGVTLLGLGRRTHALAAGARAGLAVLLQSSKDSASKNGGKHG
jgi:hypothetical protein